MAKSKRIKNSKPSSKGSEQIERAGNDKSSTSFISFAALTAAIATVGLLVAFGLVWWQLIAGPAQTSYSLEQDSRLNQFSQLINGRIDELRKTVGVLATSQSAQNAVGMYDANAVKALSNNLASQHPYIERVDIIKKGEAEVDLNSEIPISFAALDLIRRAEAREFVGPEVSLNQQQYVYAAQPITPNGVVEGVIFVIFNKAFFSDQLGHFEARGKLTVKQQIAGSAPTTIIDWGRVSDAGTPIEAQLFAPNWTLAYAASRENTGALGGIADLYVPFAVIWVVLLAAIFLGFSRQSRKLQADIEELVAYTSRVISKKPARLGQYNLDVVGQAAQAISSFDRVSQNSQPTNSADSADSADAAPSAASNQTKAAAPVKQKANPAADSANDFLDVRSTNPEENFGIEVSEEEPSPTMGLNLDPGIFRAYDIRGITTSNLTEEVVYWIGRAFAAEALSQQQDRVAIGWDGRHSSEPLQRSLSQGLTEGGIDVVTIGLVPTPLLYYATYALNTGTGVMITGSHNPPEYNGLKMMIGGVTLAEEKIQRLLKRIQDNDLSEGSGDVEEIDLNDSYIDKVLEDTAVAQPLKVVVDCGNGVAGNIAPRLLTELGCEVVPLYCDVDGDFPNHHPDPAEPENLQDLITVVQAENADLGLAFDGDGDRVGVVTNSGEIIWPDKLIMLFAQDIVSRNPGADIIYDVKCSRHLNNIISELGGRPIMWKTGHSHIKAKIKETGALLGGEFSGHICFGERWYGFDDALYSAVRLLEILGSESRDADEVFAQFPVTYTTPEIKITTTEEEKFKVMERLEAQADFGDGTVTSIDGIRVDFSDGWGLIRPSNTSPVLSLRFEADGPGALDRIQDEFQAQLTAVAPDLNFR